MMMNIALIARRLMPMPDFYVNNSPKKSAVKIMTNTKLNRSRAAMPFVEPFFFLFVFIWLESDFLPNRAQQNVLPCHPDMQNIGSSDHYRSLVLDCVKCQQPNQG